MKKKYHVYLGLALLVGFLNLAGIVRAQTPDATKETVGDCKKIQAAIDRQQTNLNYATADLKASQDSDSNQGGVVSAATIRLQKKIKRIQKRLAALQRGLQNCQ